LLYFNVRAFESSVTVLTELDLLRKFRALVHLRFQIVDCNAKPTEANFMRALDRNAFHGMIEFVSSLWDEFVAKGADCEQVQDVSRPDGAHWVPSQSWLEFLGGAISGIFKIVIKLRGQSADRSG
jgi:hypothetical protein